MSGKPVSYEGLRFWIGEFVSEGKGWRSIHRFLCKEKRSYFYHLKRHSSHFPDSLPKSERHLLIALF